MSKNSKDYELPPKKDLTVKKRLETIIVRSLGGPRGDPDRHHMLAAAHAFLLSKQLGFETDKDMEDNLRRNNWELDFIDLAERDVAL